MDEEKLIDSILNDAHRLRRAGNRSAAAKACRDGVRLYPTAHRLLHVLGLLAVESKQHDEASNFFRLCVRLFPQSSLYRSNFGAVLATLDRLEEAVGEFAEAIRLDPNNLSARDQLAAAMERSISRASADRPHLEHPKRRLLAIGPHRLICCGPPDRVSIGNDVQMPWADEDPVLVNTFAGTVTFEDWCMIGYGLQVHTGTHDPAMVERARRASPSSGRDVVLKKGVWTGARVTILGPAEIGEHAVIGACSLVTGNVPAGEIWAGNPAKFVRKALQQNS